MAKKYNSWEEVPKEIKTKLEDYFSNVGGTTFVIYGLPPELTGGALARYSRASTGMQLTLLNEFLDENGVPSQAKGTELMDRVLNAYGDDSVGELEGVHVGIEDISQIGTKFIEDRRIGGSPIEQSTRYVKYDLKDKNGKWRYLRPKEITESGKLDLFESVNDSAFGVYSEGVKRLTEYFKNQLPKDKFSIEGIRDGKKVKLIEKELLDEVEKKAFQTAYNFTVRCAALDVGRCVLPSSTLTHLGIFGNGRFMTNLITYMKSNELHEARDRGSELEKELDKVIPTFVKRNRINPKVIEINKQMRNIAHELFSTIKPHDKKVTLTNRSDYLNEVVASSLFPYTNISLNQIIEETEKLSTDKKNEILNIYMGNRETRRDRTGRGFEAGYPITFDLVGGFAEYRDLERHRMLTQQRQDLTTDLGFIMPSEMIEVGMEKEVREVVEKMEYLNSEIKNTGQYNAAQYATLFNHRMRFMLGMNLREFQHLSELRTQPAGHFSYRSMVMEMGRELEKRDPWAANAYGFINYSDPDNKITRANEQSKIAGKNLAKKIDDNTEFD
ncbi:MAG: FAD-dependent thymidylate synthase [Nanoarchaeota archaeon]|nr:FAD-dependent thymidylate synthase [Nanoarchaeota archaeon]